MYKKENFSILALILLYFAPLKCTGISGGEESSENEFPHLISLNWSNVHICTGTILNDFWILTTGKCAEMGGPSSYKAIGGVHDLFDNNEDKWQIRNIEKIVIHPDYNYDTLENNIAMMRVSEPFQRNFYVQPAFLPVSLHEPTEPFIIAGWGSENKTGPIYTKVHKITQIPLVNLETCRQFYPGRIISDQMFCSGDNLKDSCQTNGAPLLCSDTGENYVCGLVSIPECGASPSINIAVSHYIDFLEENAII